MSEVKERPILFSGEMVRAILDGRKAQTRRVMKPQLPNEYRPVTISTVSPHWGFSRDGMSSRRIRCPYGKIGDRLWVRETWLYVGPGSGSELPFAIEETKDPVNHIRENVWYRATKPDDSLRWEPSIFMPRWASRILLEVTGVRVERVQDISETDAKAEGVDSVSEYARLWDTINAKRGYSWKDNPFVWVVEFKRIAPIPA